MLTSFNHTGIVVQDIDAMVEFYTGKLGLRVTDRYETDAGDHRDHTGVSGARRVLVFLQRRWRPIRDRPGVLEDRRRIGVGRRLLPGPRGQLAGAHRGLAGC